MSTRTPTAPATPPPRSPLAWRASVAVVAALAVTTIWFASGRESLASPGPITRAHADVAGPAQCAACHTPLQGVADDGCSLCHDPMASGRFSPAAHLTSARRPPEPHRAGLTTGCATCHTEHDGPDASLLPAGDDGCRTCHTGTWDAHPEFGIFEAGAADGHLALSHAIHIAEVEATLGAGCEGCHRRAADAAHFDPIDFDRDCASCHIEDGVLVEVDVETDRPHRDPEVIATLARAGLADDPEAPAQSRASLALSQAALDRGLAGLRDLDAARLAPPMTSARARRWAERGIPVVVPETSERDVAREAAWIEARAEIARRIAELDTLTRTGAPPAPEGDLRARADAAVEPCLTCHQASGFRLQPVTAARPELVAARFSHAPHVALADVGCETCHQAIDRSGSAGDLNLPRIATCRDCHGVRDDAPVSCTACHVFHRSPPGLPRPR